MGRADDETFTDLKIVSFDLTFEFERLCLVELTRLAGNSENFDCQSFVSRVRFAQLICLSIASESTVALLPNRLCSTVFKLFRDTNVQAYFTFSESLYPRRTCLQYVK